MPIRFIERLLLTLGLIGLIAAPPAFARTHTETIAGWHISSGGSGDGGHEVRLTRRGPGYRYEHQLEYWHGNGGVVIADSFRRGRCRSGDASAIVPVGLGTSRVTFDQRLADYLRECPLPRAEAAALRRSLARAWPHFLRHARRARAAMEADRAAIARHGAAP